VRTKFDIYVVKTKKKDKNKTKQTKGNKTKLLTHSIKGGGGKDKLLRDRIMCSRTLYIHVYKTHNSVFVKIGINITSV